MARNGHVKPATWTPEDFADLEQLNAPIEVDIFDGQKPPVLVDARGYDTLAYLGEVGNPLITEALAAFDAIRTHRERPDDDGTEALLLWRDMQDKALAAILVHPPYCRKDALVDGKPPPGHLWYGSFTGDQRRALVEFFSQGASALKSFRAEQLPDGAALRAGQVLRDAMERRADSHGAGLSAVLARRGDGAVALTAPGARRPRRKPDGRADT